jgi:hypothetical protein
MAYTSIELNARVDVVHDVLIDVHTYPRWLIGASEIRDVDRTWPAPGSCFHHRVGVGPLKLSDDSCVLEHEPARMLRLAVRVRPFLSAVVTFRLVGERQRCVLTWEEDPALRLIGNLVRPLLDPLTHVRNHRSLQRIFAVVAGRTGVDRSRAPSV